MTESVATNEGFSASVWRVLGQVCRFRVPLFSQTTALPNQKLDTPLQRLVVAFAHDYIDMPSVVVDEGLPERCEIPCR